MPPGADGPIIAKRLALIQSELKTRAESIPFPARCLPTHSIRSKFDSLDTVRKATSRSKIAHAGTEFIVATRPNAQAFCQVPNAEFKCAANI